MEFRAIKKNDPNSLAHHGVKGMKWGVHNTDTQRKYGEIGKGAGGGGGAGGDVKSTDDEEWKKLKEELDKQYMEGKISADYYTEKLNNAKKNGKHYPAVTPATKLKGPVLKETAKTISNAARIAGMTEKGKAAKVAAQERKKNAVMNRVANAINSKSFTNSSGGKTFVNVKPSGDYESESKRKLSDGRTVTIHTWGVRTGTR